MRQTATYWDLESDGYDEFGDPLVNDPVLLTVRWENKTVLFIDTRTGDQAQSRAVVYSIDELEAGGYLLYGESVVTDPTALSTTDQIRRVDRVPDLRNSQILYKAYL